MTVSAVLHRSADLRPDHPLFVSLPPSASGGIGNSTVPPSIVTYSEAQEISDAHRLWIERWVEDELSSLLLRATGETDGTHATVGDVVVAYLSGNRPDLLLSALGCTDSRARCGGGRPAKSMVAAGGEGTDNFDVVDVRPTLLNFRWTSSEIARAVRVHHPDADVSWDGGGHGNPPPAVRLTLFLYGPGFETTATEAARHIESDAEQRRWGHRARAAPLPNFASFVRGSGAGALSKPHGVSRLASLASLDDDALLLFTSGTSSASGGAKGVRLSHRSLIVQSMAKLCPPCSYDARTNMVASTVPFFHVGGLSSALAVIMAGGTLTFPPAPPVAASGKQGGVKAQGFDPEAVRAALTPVQPSGRSAEVRSAELRPADTLVVVPAMLHSLLGDEDGNEPGQQQQQSVHYPHVRLILVGGQSLTASQLSRTRRTFPNAAVVQTYACTEAASSITFAQLVGRGGASGKGPSRTTAKEALLAGGGSHVSGSEQRQGHAPGGGGGDFVGHPPAHVELAVFRPRDDDDDDSDESSKANGSADDSRRPNAAAPRRLRRAATGEVGVIGTRGPHVMTGYWRRRGGCNDTTGNGNGNGNGGGDRIGIGPDGWLLTGDLGYLGIGNNGGGGGGLTFCGRAADVVRTGGETVLSSEVERAILLSSSSSSSSSNSPGRRRTLAVAECAVFALPDERFGEAVCAAVVLAGGGDVKNGDVQKQQGESSEGVVVVEDDAVRDELRRVCETAGLSGYKRPRRAFVFVSPSSSPGLPRNSSGKVLKRVLVGMCARAAAAASRVRPRSKL